MNLEEAKVFVTKMKNEEVLLSEEGVKQLVTSTRKMLAIVDIVAFEAQKKMLAESGTGSTLPVEEARQLRFALYKEVCLNVILASATPRESYNV